MTLTLIACLLLLAYSCYRLNKRVIYLREDLNTTTELVRRCNISCGDIREDITCLYESTADLREDVEEVKDLGRNVSKMRFEVHRLKRSLRNRQYTRFITEIYNKLPLDFASRSFNYQKTVLNAALVSYFIELDVRLTPVEKVEESATSEVDVLELGFYERPFDGDVDTFSCKTPFAQPSHCRGTFMVYNGLSDGVRLCVFKYQRWYNERKAAGTLPPVALKAPTAQGWVCNPNESPSDSSNLADAEVQTHNEIQ